MASSLRSRSELDLATESGASASTWALNDLEVPRSPRYGHGSQFSGSSNDTDGLPPPRPAYSRPVSYGMPSPTHSTDKLLYYGRVTPNRGFRDSTATSLRPRDSVATSLMYSGGNGSPTPGTPVSQTPNQSVADLHQHQNLEDLRMVLGDAFGKEGNPQDAPCVVEQVHKQDDVDHMPKWKKYLHALTPLLSILSVGSYWVYFAFRIVYVLDAQAQSHKTFIMAWTFIAVEAGVAC